MAGVVGVGSSVDTSTIQHSEITHDFIYSNVGKIAILLEADILGQDCGSQQ